MQPSLRCVWFLGVGLPVAMLPIVAGPQWWLVWLTYLGAVVLLAGFDLLLAIWPRRLVVSAEVPETLFIGARGTMAVRVLTGGHWMPWRGLLLCETDAILAPQEKVRIGPSQNGIVRVVLPLVPLRRGTARIERIWLRWRGPLGMMELRKVHQVGREIAVLPNVRAVRAAALRFYSNQEFLAGLKVERYAGEGSEFDALREYVPGLDHRAIDWKASARHRQLLCRQFRAERNHQIILTFDTGHLMREPMDGIPKIDRAINAGLMLAYLSLRAGDRTGVFAFDREVRAYCEPRGGLHSFRDLQMAVARLDYSTHETNFTLGLAELATRLRRRSLVVLLTDFVDTITAELMVENLGRLTQRHLVLFVTLHDPELDRIAGAAPTAMISMARAAVATDFLRDREVVLRRLARLGIHTIDAHPNNVTSALLNRYLEIKGRELIS